MREDGQRTSPADLEVILARALAHPLHGDPTDAPPEPGEPPPRPGGRSYLVDLTGQLVQRGAALNEALLGDLGERLGIPRVELRDSLSFYHFLPLGPRGRKTLYLCDSLVERLHGSERVALALEEAAGVRFGQTTPDGALTLERAPCMGLGDQGPSALVEGVPLTCLTPAQAPGLVEALRAGIDPATLPEAGVRPNLRQPGPVVFAPWTRGAALRRALGMGPEEVIEEIQASGLRGAGGGGYPTGRKWAACRGVSAPDRVVVCNADEGEPGTFKDREVLRRRADQVFEGMAVAGWALGASQGYLYLRGEYEWLRPQLLEVLRELRAAHLLGPNTLGRDFHFDIEIRTGAGAYVCGEETALLESMEGRRGVPRERPPFPTERGYLGLPTVINNVETLASAARILERGAAWYARMGTAESKGTRLLSISGDCLRPGVYEVEHGTRLSEILDLAGASQALAVQLSGPSGRCLPPSRFDGRISFEELPTAGSLIPLGPGRDLLEAMQVWTRFFRDESCGWCTPCRVGTVLLDQQLARIREGRAGQQLLDELRRLARTMQATSRCGLGVTAPNPLLSLLEDFPALIKTRPGGDRAGNPTFDLEAAMGPALAARRGLSAGPYGPHPDPTLEEEPA